MSLTFKKRVSAVCSTATDTVSARLEITGLGPREIRALGTSRKEGPYRLTLRHDLGNVVVVFVMHTRGLVRCQVLTTGKVLRVLLGTIDRREFLQDILKSLLEPLPVTYDTTASRQLKKVRKLLLARSYSKALKALVKLRRRANLRDYIAMRRADIHMLAGRVPTAYVKYKNIQELMTARSMRLLARTRAAEVAYVVDHVAPDSLLIKSLQRPTTALGQLARQRLIKILTRLGRLEQALALARIHPNKDAVQLNNRLLVGLQRRYLSQGKPYEATLAYLRTRRKLPKTPARAEALVLAGQAYMDLDLPADAVKVLQQALAANNDPRTRERVLSLLAQAYVGSKQYYRARQTTDFYTASFKKQGPRYETMVEVRAGLKLREGDLAGARADLALLNPDRAKKLRRLLDLKSGKSAPESELLSRAHSSQDAILRKMEAKR